MVTCWLPLEQSLHCPYCPPNVSTRQLVRSLIRATWHWHGNNSLTDQSECRLMDLISNQGPSVVFWDTLLHWYNIFHIFPHLVTVSSSVYSKSVSRDDDFQSDCFTDMRNSAGGMFSPWSKSLTRECKVAGSRIIYREKICVLVIKTEVETGVKSAVRLFFFITMKMWWCERPFSHLKLL